MTGASITLNEYLRHVYKWKERYFYEGASTLCLKLIGFKAAIQPNGKSNTSFFKRFFKKIPLEKLLSEIQQIKISPEMLKERNDLEKISPEDLSQMPEKERSQIELMKRLMESAGQDYQTQLEFLTEPFRSTEALMQSITGDGVHLSASLNDFPYGEFLQLESFNCSLMASPAPYICLKDRNERKWYFDMQIMMHTSDLSIDGEVVAQKLGKSLKPFGFR
jgi:hypothetical protein